MSYTPTEWGPTDVVTATRMNALEQAVGDMNMSYTPNVWSDGDILSAGKMNALEQAVASGGGGGSSDFNKAMVTVTNNHNGADFQLKPIELSGEVIGFRFGVNGVETAKDAFYYDYGTSVTDTYYIYHDCSMIAYSETLADPNFYTVTGDAEVTTIEGAPFPIIRIFGDCTITIS